MMIFSQISGYYDFIGKTAATILGHQLSEYLVECYFLTLTGTEVQPKPCQQKGRIKLLSSPKHFNCYTIEYFAGKGHNEKWRGGTIQFLDSCQPDEGGVQSATQTVTQTRI